MQCLEETLNLITTVAFLWGKDFKSAMITTFHFLLLTAMHAL